jgi:hypothetical protein
MDIGIQNEMFMLHVFVVRISILGVRIFFSHVSTIFTAKDGPLVSDESGRERIQSGFTTPHQEMDGALDLANILNSAKEPIHTIEKTRLLVKPSPSCARHLSISSNR